MKIIPTWFTALILLVVSSQAGAEQLWTSKEFESLCNNAKSPGKEELAAAMGSYLNVLKGKEDVDINRIKIPDVKNIEAALDKAIKLNWAALEFFTEPNFTTGKPCLVFMNEEMLQAVNKKYNLHTLWMINAPYEGKTLRMKYLLMGRGKMIIGYHEPKEILVEDYGIFTGLYDYERYTSMDIINSAGKRGVFNIRTRKTALEKTTPFIGPAGSEILSLEIAPDNNNEILIKCRETWIVPAEQRVDRIRFEYRKDEV